MNLGSAQLCLSIIIETFICVKKKFINTISIKLLI